MNVCFETFGCRLNKAEALQMEADYLAEGWTVVKEHKKADLFVVRGCSVTSHAQHEGERMVAHLRKHYPLIPVRVCGCLTDPTKSSHIRFGSARKVEVGTSVAVPTRTARAYLKVQDGCSGRCAFCIVPKFRGASRSEDFSSVLDKAKRFVDAGYHELVVTGCNLALYASQGKRLPDLVNALAKVDAGCRVRLGSVEPGDCALETVHAMSAHENVCRFLHLTIQSGSDRILRAMRRSYNVKKVGEVVEAATRLMPCLGLSCDLMTGFPDESDIDFAATHGLLTRFPFTNAHVFPFSTRPGTVAAKLPNAVPKPVRKARAHELIALMKEKRVKAAKAYWGKPVDIVVEDEGKCRGWTGERFACRIKGGVAKRKSLVAAQVIRVEGEELIAKTR